MQLLHTDVVEQLRHPSIACEHAINSKLEEYILRLHLFY
jgi:hypothetical protein